VRRAAGTQIPMETILVICVVLLMMIAAVGLFSVIAKWRNPPLGRFIDCGGVRLHYLERGESDAPCLVMLHGNGSMIQDFVISGLVDRAAGRYRVLCFDRPGFAHSTRPRDRAWTPEAQAELFAEVFRQLGVNRPVVLAHSWATLVALSLALRPSADLQGLVLASGYYFPTPRADLWLFSLPAVPVFGDLLRYTIAPPLGWLLMPKIVRANFAPRAVSESFLHLFPKSLALRPPHTRAVAEETALMIPAAARLQHRYRDVTCPVAAITGDGDKVVEPQQTARLHQLLPRSVLQTIPAAGHMVHYAAADALVDAVALVGEGSL
jgi:pimeloyl-ACP methyl ester carboxylesterase